MKPPIPAGSLTSARRPADPLAMQPQNHDAGAESPRPYAPDRTTIGQSETGEHHHAAPSSGLEPVIATLFSGATSPDPAEVETVPEHANGQPPSNRPSDSSAAARIAITPRTAIIIAACLVTLTAHSLGATWLGARFLLIPIGLWIVGVAVLLCELGPQRLHRTALNFLDSLDLLLGRVLARVDEESSSRLARLGSRLGKMYTAAVTPLVRPRIGLDLAAGEAEAVLSSAQNLSRMGESLWIRTGSREHGCVSPSQIALLRRVPGDDHAVELIVPERSGRKAVWWNWSQPLPLGYAAVFPPRLDPGHIRLATVDFDHAGQVRLLVLLAQAAAAHALAATPGFAERLRNGASIAPPIPTAFDPQVATQRLAREFERQADAVRGTPVAGAAARMLSAWCVDPDHRMDQADRKRLLELCSRMLPDEPEIALRCATGYFAVHEDQRGRQLILDAYEHLRERQGCFTDPLAFVFSEIETGRDSPLTVGRVAAGYALVWATAPEDRLPFLAGDLADELRYANWLVGRDQDHRLLLRIIQELDGVHASRGTLWARENGDGEANEVRLRRTLRGPDSRAA